MVQIPGPFYILMDQSFKPVLHFLSGFNLLKPTDLLRLNIAVGKLNPNFFQIMVNGIYSSIAKRLSHMDRIRLLQPSRIHINTFDLINGHSAGLCDDPIGPSLNEKLKRILFYCML